MAVPMTLPDLPPPAEPVLSNPLVARRRRRHVEVGRVELTVLALRRHPGWLAAGSLLLVLGSALVIVPWAAYARDAQIAREGVETVATVVRQETTADADETSEYHVRYAFALPDGTVQQGEAVVAQESAGSLALGNSIRVLYDPSDPANSFPLGDGSGVGSRSAWVAALLSLTGAVLAGLGGFFLWGLLVRGPGLWHRLLQNGHEAEGRVVEVEADGGGSRARIHYAFPDRRGWERSGTTGWVPPGVSDGWSPGDPGIVCYAQRDASESVWLGRGGLSFFR